MTKTIAIIGAGASGMFVAANIKCPPNWSILIFEQSKQPMQKVLVSGGGRCNVTHSYVRPSVFPKSYPRGKSLIKKAFEKFSPLDIVQWFENRGVTMVTEADGRMFPSTHLSSTIADTIRHAVEQAGANIKMSTQIQSIAKHGSDYILTDQHAHEYVAQIVVAASGGASSAKYLEMWHQLGVKTVSPCPSLFTFKFVDSSITELSGISVPHASIRIVGSDLRAEGPLLITHWGVSGPAVLKLSAYGARLLADLNYDFKVHISWEANYTEAEWRHYFDSFDSLQSKALLVNKPIASIPKRLWHYLVSRAEISSSKRICDLSKRDINKLVQLLMASEWQVKGKYKYKDEFVTAGGIDISEVNHSTMEHVKFQHLFFVGELLDVDGITGGFNFQNAWTTAYLAAMRINTLCMSDDSHR